MNSKMSKDWHLLPPKALRTIFLYLNCEEQSKLKSVCENWNKIIQSFIVIDPEYGGTEDDDEVPEEVGSAEYWRKQVKLLGKAKGLPKPFNQETMILYQICIHYRNLSKLPGTSQKDKAKYLELSKENSRKISSLKKAKKEAKKMKSGKVSANFFLEDSRLLRPCHLLQSRDGTYIVGRKR